MEETSDSNNAVAQAKELDFEDEFVAAQAQGLQ